MLLIQLVWYVVYSLATHIFSFPFSCTLFSIVINVLGVPFRFVFTGILIMAE